MSPKGKKRKREMGFKEHYLVQMSLQFWIQDENVHLF